MTLRKVARQKSDADVDENSSSSEGETPPPIPARKGSTPVNKRMKPEKGIDVSNILRAPTRESVHMGLPTLSESEAPSPKRQRVTRQRGHNPLNYDARLHPLDKYTRPSRFAKINAEYGRVTENSEHGVILDKDNDADVDGSDQILQASREDPSDSNEVGASEVMELPADSSSHTQIHAASPSHLPSPGCRRSSRTLDRSEVPNYDMKVRLDYDRVHRPATFRAALARRHCELKSRRTSAEAETMSTLVDNDTTALDLPVDHPLRDAAPTNLTLSKVQSIAIPPLSQPRSSTQAKRKVKSPSRSSSGSGKGLSEIPSSKAKRSAKSLSDTRQSASETLPSRNNHFSNTLDEFTAIDFHDLSSLDSRLYRLQYGAPTNGDTLPNTWQYVKQDLFENGHICLDDLNSRDYTERIKTHYEMVRMGVEAFWASKPEPVDARDWTLRRMEGLKIFDQKPKSKYWKHYEDSLYQPTSTSWPDGQVTEMHNKGEVLNEVLDPPSLLQYHESEKHATPCIVGADGVASGVPSPVHTRSERGPTLGFRNRNREQSYIDLGAGDEDEDHKDIDPDHTLVEIMRDTVQSSDPLIGTQELTDLLSPVAEYLTDYMVGSPTDIILSDPASSDATGWPPVHLDRDAKLSPKSPPRLMEAFEDDKAMSAPVADELDNSLYIDLLQAATVAVRGKKPRARKGQKIVIHEDSPGRKAATVNVKSPKTDLLKENFEEEEPDFSTDVHLRTPTTRQPHEAVVAPSTPKAVPGNERHIPTQTSLFGGPIGWTSPST